MSNDSSDSTGTNVLKYVITTTIAALLIVSYYSVSGLVLYGVKAAASGILPTDSDYYPYTEDKNQVKVGEIVSNIFTTYTDPPLSEKISFYPKQGDPSSVHTSNFVLDHIRKYHSSNNTSRLMNYFTAILETLLSFDYWVLNKSLGALNSLPEVLIVMFGPIVIWFMSVCLIVANYVYLMILWFYNMHLFFNSGSCNKSGKTGKTEKPKKTNDDLEDPDNGLIYGFFLIWWTSIFGNKKTKPASTTSGDNNSGGGTSFIDIVIGCFMVGIFTILFFLMLLVGWGFFPALLTFYCLISIVCYSAEINDKKSSAMDVIKRVFRFYKKTISTVISVVFVSSTFSFLGVKLGIISAVVMLLILFFGMGITLFKPEKIDGLTPMIETTSESIGGSKKSNISKLLFQSGGGINFIKEIKKITKKLQKHK
jgi:hypothetical protein